jgi:hypothetical protein
MATRRINLSSNQVAASVLATLTGAIAASYLGVGGTLVGAAVGSIASTVGTEVYRDYLGRTQQRLRGAVVARRDRTAGQTGVGETDPGAAQNRVGVTSRRQAGGSDAAETGSFYMQRPGDAAPPAGTGQKPTSLNDPVHDSSTETFRTANSRSQGVSAGIPMPRGHGAKGDGAEGHSAEGDSAEGSAGKGGRPRWQVLAGIVVVTFLVAVAAITVFELSVGKPLEALLWHRSGGGTTVGGVVGGQSTKTTPARTPTGTPSVTPSVTGSASPSVSATPTPSPTSLGATPSSSATPNPGGTAKIGPAATASP